MLFHYIKELYTKLNTVSNGRIFLLLSFVIRIIVIPLTYLLWIIEPFKKVRFHKGDIPRIGHLSCTFEVLIRSKEVKIDSKDILEIFIVGKNAAANFTLYNMWRRKLFFIENNTLNFIYALCGVWLKNRKHFGPSNILHGSLPYSKPSIEFTETQILEGKKKSQEIGIKQNEWFVCLHNRSPIYLDEKFPKHKWAFHNIRDCDFKNLYQAANLIKEKGGKCVRMSSGEKEKLDKEAPSNIIDYAYYNQTDFLDIYLLAKCKFFLGPQSGLLNVSLIFNIPVAATNVIPLGCAYVPVNSLFIPKLLWYKEQKRFLSYKEILNSNLQNSLKISDFHSLGIEVIDNDPDDIRLLTQDMFDLLRKKSLFCKDDKLVNNFMEEYFEEGKFVNEFTSKHKKFEFAGQISRRFLLKHSYLMNDK